VIAVDTNILVYAHRIESPWHAAAKQCIATVSMGNAQWTIPWPCIHEFIGITTHSRIYVVPTPIVLALEQVQAWCQSPSMTAIGETGVHLKTLTAIASAAKLSGPKIHDAKIAAICLQHGVTELWTSDRDFSLFPALKTRNPLVK
jgi:toxin-antitoxin system PIN domain toxin